jgi:hypothetical protein
VAIPNRSSAATNSPTVGLEGHAIVELPRKDYQTKPVDDRSDLILRIEQVAQVATNSFRYDLYYIGLEPRAYDLGGYLLRANGEPASELSNIMIRVGSLLPSDHDGSLLDAVRSPFPFLGGYRAALAAFIVIWTGGLIYFARTMRRKKVPPPPPPTPPPSLAERMLPLVEAAASGKLSADGQAQLERLMLGYWRGRLRLSPDLPMALALAQMKNHPEAGRLVRALEMWLHSPLGATESEIKNLLAPYSSAR